MGKMTKGRSKAQTRRVMRSREKGGQLRRDIPLGRAAARSYGTGVALVRTNKG